MPKTINQSWDWFMESKPFINEMYYNMPDSAFGIFPHKEAENFRREYLKTKILWDERVNINIFLSS
jgi:hypothetical protein